MLTLGRGGSIYLDEPWVCARSGVCGLFYGVILCLCWRWDVWLAVSILGYQTGKTGIRNLNHGRDL